MIFLPARARLPSIAPGPELIRVNDANFVRPSITASLATSPPKEWPTRWTGSPPPMIWASPSTSVPRAAHV